MVEVVDIASTVKARDTQVNIAKLVKAEAKIKAKMEKRSARNAYEGSKLVDASRQQVSPAYCHVSVKSSRNCSLEIIRGALLGGQSAAVGECIKGEIERYCSRIYRRLFRIAPHLVECYAQSRARTVSRSSPSSRKQN